MYDNRQIGVYDSGVGGLTVLKKLKKLLPNESFVYYGDTVNIPYGTKTKEELLKITQKTMKFFKEKNVKSVVMACNTTSAAVYEDLKDDVDFILYPLVQNACKNIAALKADKIGVLSTEVTANSHAYKNNLQKYRKEIEVFEHGCPSDWVKIVENNLLSTIGCQQIIKEHLNILLDKNPDIIILGCTHYPYLKNLLVQFAGKDIFIDPAEYFADFIVKDLTQRNILSETKKSDDKFFVTSDTEKFFSSSQLFYKLDEKPILI